MTAQRHHALPVEPPPSNRYSILVVDDSRTNRVLLGKILAATGYEVVEAENGREALDLLLEGNCRPDLVLTDLEMPVMDGIRLVSEIRASGTPWAGIPVIAASGSSDPSLRLEALEAGAEIFLAKPLGVDDLRKQVAHQLRRRSPEPVRARHPRPRLGHRL